MLGRETSRPTLGHKAPTVRDGQSLYEQPLKSTAESSNNDMSMAAERVYLRPDRRFRSQETTHFSEQREIPNWRPRADMCALHSKTADISRQTCPNCKHTKMLKTAKPDEEQPRKNYCIECGHEWWEFDKRPVVRRDSHGL